jgi:hypothetical protein
MSELQEILKARRLCILGLVFNSLAVIFNLILFYKSHHYFSEIAGLINLFIVIYLFREVKKLNVVIKWLQIIYFHSNKIIKA